MKQMGLQPEHPTYTALFNACANSPWKEDGLKRANHLRELIAEKEYEPNVITYQAMIKCYALHGDIQTAFQIADEMVERGVGLQPDTFCFLLMACISDQELGLRLAIQVLQAPSNSGTQYFKVC